MLRSAAESQRVMYPTPPLIRRTMYRTNAQNYLEFLAHHVGSVPRKYLCFEPVEFVRERA